MCGWQLSQHPGGNGCQEQPFAKTLCVLEQIFRTQRALEKYYILFMK